MRLREDSGSGVGIRVVVADGRLELLLGEESIGEWALGEIGVHAVNEGFVIRAEGEELILTVEDEAGLAEEMGVIAATPRLARKVAARHNPERESRSRRVESPEVPSRVGAIAFALAGVLVVLGGTFLRSANAEPAFAQARVEILEGSGVEFWLAFVVGGVLMVALAYVLSTGRSWARIAAIGLVAVVIILFGIAVSDAVADAGHVTAYGFIAGGLVVGVAVLFGGSISNID